MLYKYWTGTWRAEYISIDQYSVLKTLFIWCLCLNLSDFFILYKRILHDPIELFVVAGRYGFIQRFLLFIVIQHVHRWISFEYTSDFSWQYILFRVIMWLYGQLSFSTAPGSYQLMARENMGYICIQIGCFQAMSMECQYAYLRTDIIIEQLTARETRVIIGDVFRPCPWNASVPICWYYLRLWYW